MCALVFHALGRDQESLAGDLRPSCFRHLGEPLPGQNQRQHESAVRVADLFGALPDRAELAIIRRTLTLPIKVPAA
jgi:hypothetical protein